ncbi:MAG: hypothetical protein JRI80_04860 [Deltaproteobacteria bacterium]|nr:hypothetical protein [Deltaproteobacteria bacterium]
MGFSALEDDKKDRLSLPEGISWDDIAMIDRGPTAPPTEEPELPHGLTWESIAAVEEVPEPPPFSDRVPGVGGLALWLSQAGKKGAKEFGKGVVGAFPEMAGSVGTGLQYLGARMKGGWLEKRIPIGGGKTMADLGAEWERMGREAYSYWQEVGQPFQEAPEYRGKNVWDNPEILKDPVWWLFQIGRMGTQLGVQAGAGMTSLNMIRQIGSAAKLAPHILEGLSEIGAALVGGAIGSGLEATQTYQDVLAQTGNEEEAARAAEGMFGAVIALNTISMEKILAKAGEGLVAKLMKVGGAAFTEGITEGAEEPAEVSAKLLAKILTGQELPGNVKEMFIDSLKSALTVMGPAAVTGGGMAGLTEVNMPERAGEKRVDILRPVLLDSLRNDLADGTLGIADVEAMKKLRPELTPDLNHIISEHVIRRAERSMQDARGIGEGTETTGGPEGPPWETEEGLYLRDAEKNRMEAPQGEGEPIPLTDIATPPLNSARESAKVLIEAAKDEEQKRIAQTNLEERYRRSIEFKEAFKRDLQERSELSAVYGLEGLAPYLRQFADQLHYGQRGRRYWLEPDYDSTTRRVIGATADLPDWFRENQKRYGWDRHKAAEAIERGLAGADLGDIGAGTGMAAMWHDALIAAEDQRNADYMKYAAQIEADPSLIKDMPLEEYKIMLEVLKDEDVYAGPITEAAALFRKEAEGEAIGAVSEELGISEEEFRAILEDENIPEVDIERAWEELSQEDENFLVQWDRERADREAKRLMPGEPRSGGTVETLAEGTPQEGVRPSRIVEKPEPTPDMGPTPFQRLRGALHGKKGKFVEGRQSEPWRQDAGKLKPRDYQDAYPEKTVHEDWDRANSPRYDLEGAGDIIREFQKSDPDWGYIKEKMDRVGRLISGELSGKVHPDDSIAAAVKYAPEKLQRLISQYEHLR